MHIVGRIMTCIACLCCRTKGNKDGYFKSLTQNVAKNLKSLCEAVRKFAKEPTENVKRNVEPKTLDLKRSVASLRFEPSETGKIVETFISENLLRDCIKQLTDLTNMCFDEKSSLRTEFESVPATIFEGVVELLDVLFPTPSDQGTEGRPTKASEYAQPAFGHGPGVLDAELCHCLSTSLLKAQQDKQSAEKSEQKSAAWKKGEISYKEIVIKVIILNLQNTFMAKRTR